MKHLDLEEQEQLDSLKAFWKQYSNLIYGALIVVFGSIAAYNWYQWRQADQAAQAAGMFDIVENAAQQGDVAKLGTAFADMKERFSGSTYAAQAGLLTGKTLYEKGQAEQAKAPLEWVAKSASEESYRAIAKLRLASLEFEAKNYDAALKLTEDLPKEFAALAADRRGDILLAQGKRDEAKAAFEVAHKAMDERSDYRKMIEVKLNALGLDITSKRAAEMDAAAAKVANGANSGVSAGAASAAPAAPAASASQAKQ